MKTDDTVFLRTAVQRGYDVHSAKRTLSQWSFEKQLRELSLSQRNLEVADKKFVNCIRIDPSSNQL